MKISELIRRLEIAKTLEGDIEVELPDGTLLHQVHVITKRKEPDEPRTKTLSKAE